MQKLSGIFVLLVLISGTFSTNFAFAGDSSEITAYSTSDVILPFENASLVFTGTTTTGSIKITEITVPADETDFVFISTTLADLNAEEDGVFTLQDNDNEEDGKPSMVEYTGLAPNETYDISETTNGDYTTTISCTDEQNPAALFLDPNEAIECIFTNTVNPGSIDSKVTQMGMVIGSLTGLKDTTDDKTDKKIDKIIKKIDKAMNSKYWDESGNDLVSKKGQKVFDDTKKAVKDLSKISKKSDMVYPEITSAVDMLVGISNQLATDANDDAQTFAGDKKADKEIKKSNKEMNKAQKELDKGKPDKAIDKFKKAWEHALKAMKEKKVKDPKPIKEDKSKKEKKSKSDKKRDD